MLHLLSAIYISKIYSKDQVVCAGYYKELEIKTNSDIIPLISETAKSVISTSCNSQIGNGK